MASSRTGVSTLRKVLRYLCNLVARYPGVITNPDVPIEISAAVAALVTVCLASEFDNLHSGEVSGMGVAP